MPIDPLADDLLTLPEAAQRMPRVRRGQPIHVSTLWRWAMSGLRGVVLETAMIGGVRVTTADALRSFLIAAQRGRRNTLAQLPDRNLRVVP